MSTLRDILEGSLIGKNIKKPIYGEVVHVSIKSYLIGSQQYDDESDLPDTEIRIELGIKTAILNLITNLSNH